MNSTNKVISKFKSIFKSSPLLISSPGRINLIGEHTDYNDGFVLPAAIDQNMIFGFSENNLNKLRVFSMDYDEEFECDIHEIQKTDISWVNYILGVIDQYQKAGYTIKGFDCVFTSTIPIGVGLSSSAALECGMAFGLNTLFDLGIAKSSQIKYAQMAEHTFAGVLCGIMDQFVNMMGKKGHAIKLDCRSLEYEYIPVHLKEYQFILCNSGVKHELSNSEYNTRRNECEAGVIVIQKDYLEVSHLRDVTLNMLNGIRNEIPPTVFKRCEHVILENERVNSACEALKQENMYAFGEFMYESHDSLSNLYEVSCKELDFLVDFTRENADVLGSRMMGGGFGGCTINLIKRSAKHSFLKSIKKAYKNYFNITLECYDVEITDGISIIDQEQ